MRVRQLKNRILLSMFAIIGVLSVSIAILGFSVIQSDIIDRAQRKVRDDLQTARSFYTGEIERIENAFKLVTCTGDTEALCKKMNLHYLRVVEAADKDQAQSELVRHVFENRQGIGGTRIMTRQELSEINPALEGATKILIKPTPKALPTDKKELDSVMVKEYAMPVFDSKGSIERVYYGGRIINRDYELVDRIQHLVFGSEQYHSKPIGTVTIFQDDTRISTNVLDENGQRAVGTRVSAQVYEKVVGKGEVWDDRAFVVNTWYKTAYEPIKNIHGQVIGILYVGALEEPFSVMARHILLKFIAIVAGTTALAVLLSFVLANGISRPLTQLIGATKKLSGGDRDFAVGGRTGVVELDNLAESFNEMSAKIDQREQSLKEFNEKLTEANKSYIDLIGFVSHELKGILASAIMNAYAVRDGLLGMVNFKQRKALDSICRNLDYLEATVMKFLNLGRIEKGDLAVNKIDLDVRKDVFNVSIESLETQAMRKNIVIENNLDGNLRVLADRDLMQIVANNLISNAIKYGREGGKIKIQSTCDATHVQVEVYNDSVPISEEQKDKLFKKFSRLETVETKKVKGTGLGLFITRQIVEKHGGQIWVQPRQAGNSFIFRIERN
jgi:two-component system NtrC family sensor kinase